MAQAFEAELAGLEARQDVAGIVRGVAAHSSHAGVAEKGCRALRNLAYNRAERSLKSCRHLHEYGKVE